MRIAILGGGATGLTLAYRLGKAGQQTAVFEKETDFGGLAAATKINGTYLEKFYHHLFQTDKDATRLIHELGLGDRLRWLQPTTSNLIGGRQYELDSAASLLRFRPLPMLDRLRVGACIAYLKAESNYHRLERMTAVHWIRRWMGPHASDVLIGPMLRSKFGARADQISMSWLWSRFHERTTKLGYIRGGFQQMYDRLAEEVVALGGAIHLKTTVDFVEQRDGAFFVAAGPHSGTFDRVVSTLPTRVTMNVVRGIPDDFRKQFDYGEAYAAQCLIVTLNRRYGSVYWLSVNDAGYPFLVLVEHTNLMPLEDYKGAHILYLGNYLPMSDPRLKLSGDDVLKSYVPALTKINPAFNEGWITGHQLFVAPFAQPIVTRDFPQHIPPHQTPLSGLYMANMFQVYPQDRGQNYAIAMAERVASLVLSDT
jgi:protoporphyrinogen oxidase